MMNVIVSVIHELAALSSSFRIHHSSFDQAGEGNRTLVFSLEGCCSTIELHPQEQRTNVEIRMTFQ
jgi:hypothetical protein